MRGKSILLGAMTSLAKGWRRGEDIKIPVDSEKVKEECLERQKLSEENKLSRRKRQRMKGKQARTNRGKNRK